MASYRNIATAGISADGVTSLSLGEVMLEGSTFPDNFTEQNDALADGRFLSAGLTGAWVLRIINPNATQLATAKAAQIAGSDLYVHLHNRGGTEIGVAGPAKVTSSHERPPSGTPLRGSIMFGFNVAGDTEDDFFTIVDTTTT